MFLDCSFGLSVLFQFMFFLEFLFAFCWKNRILSYLLLTWQHAWGQASTDSSRQGYGCEWSLSSELGDTADGQERYLVKQNLNFWAKESLSGRVMSSSWEAAHRDWGVSKLDWTQPWATWADYCTFLFPEDPFNLTNSVILWFKPPIILFVQTWAVFFGADPCFPLDLCPTAAHSPGDCRWLCRWLCRGLAEAYLTGCPAACFPVFSEDAHQGSIQFPMRGYPTGGMPFSCVDPGEMPLST